MRQIDRWGIRMQRGGRRCRLLAHPVNVRKRRLILNISRQIINLFVCNGPNETTGDDRGDGACSGGDDGGLLKQPPAPEPHKVPRRRKREPVPTRSSSFPKYRRSFDYLQVNFDLQKTSCPRSQNSVNPSTSIKAPYQANLRFMSCSRQHGIRNLCCFQCLAHAMHPHHRCTMQNRYRHCCQTGRFPSLHRRALPAMESS